MSNVKRIFISHASENTAFAETLAASLRRSGLDVWLDASHMGPGNFVDRISKALNTCDVLILVLSPAALSSQWVPEEMNAAVVRYKQGFMRPPIVVMAESVSLQAIPALWTAYNRIDATTSYSMALGQLLKALDIAPSRPAARRVPNENSLVPAPGQYPTGSLPYARQDIPVQPPKAGLRQSRPILKLPLFQRTRFLALLTLTLVVGTIVLYLTQFGLLEQRKNGTNPTATTGGSSHLTMLTPSRRFSASSDSGALAFSPNGNSVVGIADQNGVQTVGVWDVSSGKLVTTFAWGGSSAPVAFAWSPDGSMLAAADGANIGVWNVKTQAVMWLDSLPAAGLIRIYDSQSGSIVQKPDATTTFANGGLIAWGQTGQTPTIVSGAKPHVSVPGDPQVSLWQSAGTHLFASPSAGSVNIGYSSSSYISHESLLNWSPDGRYLIWSTAGEPVALTSGATTSNATPSGYPGQVPVPDLTVGATVTALAQSSKGDALLWFSPDGKLLAQCDRFGASSLDLTILNRTTDQSVSALSGVCGQLSLGSLSWAATSEEFALSVPHSPAALYFVP